MSSAIDSAALLEFLHQVWLAPLVRAALLLLLGWPLARLASRAAASFARRYGGRQETMLAQRAVFYGIITLALLAALQQLGFDLTILVGAAGILTVAVGFASQTSASNIISGLFLIGERPFVVGDTIQVGQTSGEVLAVDLLSVKLRTPDNLLVRVPNEILIKSEITNFTRFPIRRIDLTMGVAYRASIGQVREILLAVAQKNPLCLTEPEPLFIFTGFGDSALTFQFSVWVARENFLTLRNGLWEEIKQAFDETGIEIPFPQRELHIATPLRIE